MGAVLAAHAGPGPQYTAFGWDVGTSGWRVVVAGDDFAQACHDLQQLTDTTPFGARLRETISIPFTPTSVVVFDAEVTVEDVLRQIGRGAFVVVVLPDTKGGMDEALRLTKQLSAWSRDRPVSR